MKLVRVKFNDHFVSDDIEENCSLDVIGWIAKETKDYLIVSNCIQDEERFNGNFFHILKSAIKEKKCL